MEPLFERPPMTPAVFIRPQQFLFILLMKSVVDPTLCARRSDKFAFP